MATLKRTNRSNPLSRFRQVGTQAGFGFDLIATGLEELNSRLEPAAIEEMKRRGTEDGRSSALSSMGGWSVTQPDTGEGFDFASYAEGGATRPDSFTNMTAGMRGGLSGFLKAADDELGPGLKVYSGYRSPDLQDRLFKAAVEKYGSVEAARKWVAPPGRSKHNTGQAADLSFNGVRIDKLPEDHPARAWISSNVARFGLAQPMSWEPWQVEEGTARGQAPQLQQTAEPEVMVRTGDGKLEPRLYSPYSGPILQAYNAAAGVAYQSEVLNRGSMEILEISRQYPNNPNGFAEAAKGYLDQMVSDAPAMYRQGIRDGLGKEVQSRLMGVMEDQQRETLKRANNSSAALVDRWSQTYADAVAAGNTAEAQSARAQLDSVLRVRESMPGIAWTPEQSTNVFLKAERQAERQIQTRNTAVAKETKASLDLIVEAAKNGRYAESEGILSDPAVQAMHPELAREAAAFVTLRDNMPEYLTVPPDQMAAELERARQEPVQEEWQIDVLDAMETVVKENRKAWDEDPVAQAEAVMQDNPPPSMPDLGTAQADDYVSFFEARGKYMNEVFDAGFTDTRAFFSQEEADDLKAIMGPETPPQIRAAIAGAVVAGFGDDAVGVIDEIGGDSVTVFAGKMMAVTGNHTLSAEIMKGQQLLREGAITVPGKSPFSSVFQANFSDAFQGIPEGGGTAVVTQVLEASRAIYAARVGAGELEGDDADAAIQGAIAAAIGQSTNKKGLKTGGVQPIFGANTLLPPGVNGEQAQAAIIAATGPASGNAFSRMIAGGFSSDTPGVNEEAWRAASRSGSVPMQFGMPLDPNLIHNDQVRIVAAGPTGYSMEIAGGAMVEDENGNVFFFDLPTLIEEVQ